MPADRNCTHERFSATPSTLGSLDTELLWVTQELNTDCVVISRGLYAVKWRSRDGKQHWKTIGPRKRDAELFLAEVDRRLVLGTAHHARPETFGEFTDGWLARYRQRVRPATLEVALNALKHLAVFESDVVESITAATVEDHITALSERSPRSAELTLDTLKMILRSARERGQMIDEAVLGSASRAASEPRCASSPGRR